MSMGSGKIFLSLIFSASAWCGPSRADSIPSGWERDEYASYLIFSDLVPEAINWNKRAKFVCVGSTLSGAAQPTVTDPDERVVAALRERFTSIYSLRFLRKSECTKSIEGDNLYLLVDRGMETNIPDCAGDYEGTYTKGMGGGSYVYRVKKDAKPFALQRTTCQISGIMYAPY